STNLNGLRKDAIAWLGKESTHTQGRGASSLGLQGSRLGWKQHGWATVNEVES
ncbi:hypothetical protein Csa_024006, partial [Cucumis sativus]